MKKIIALLLALTMAFGTAACASNQTEAPETPETDTPVVEEPVAPEVETPAEPEEEEIPEYGAPAEGEEAGDVEVEMPEVEYMPAEKLEEMTGIIEQLVAGVDSEMAVGTIEITSDMYEFYGIPAVEGSYAIASVAMMNAVAHEVILVEMPEGTDMEAAKADMEAGQDPMKWLCVQPEVNWVKANGNYLLGVMSFQNFADTIATNFDTVIGG